MATFHEVLSELRASALSPAEKGNRFERLILQLFRQDPLYRQEYRRVWLWGDWPDSPHGDLGIDLVAERADGDGYAAIQCKCYEEGASVSKEDVRAFLTASGNKKFTARFFITTGALGGTALKQLGDADNPSVSILYSTDLAERDFHWATLAERVEDTRHTGAKFVPRPDQTEAIRRTLGRLYGQWRVPEKWPGAEPGNRTEVAELNEGDERIYDRGQVLMPCGTGKTFTALNIAEQAAQLGGGVGVWTSRSESSTCCPAFRFSGRRCGNGRSRKASVCASWGSAPMSAPGAPRTKSVISPNWKFR